MSDLDLKSIEVKENLNPDIWLSDKSLNPVVRSRLLQIAQHFYEELGVDWAKLKDIRFTGSLANYNWSKYSDVDLHLILNFEDVDEKVDLVSNYFKARKSQWNSGHDIKVYGFDVEVYVENFGEKHIASGLYSVLLDRWLVEPKKQNPVVNKAAIKHKSLGLMKMIDGIDEYFETKEFKKIIALSDRLQAKIKNMRNCGLEKNGEFSPENLTFKLLRRNGYIGKLYDMETKAYDALMTIK